MYIWIIAFLLIVAIGLIVMRLRFKPIKMHFTYNLKDVKVYRNDFKDTSQDKKSDNNLSVGANMDLAIFPLYDDDGKSAGTLQSTASIIKNVDKTNDVFQNITYVLKDGTISVRLYFKNDENSIFPEENSFKVPIMTGTGSYSHKKGKVEIKVNKDGSRDLSIEMVGEY